MTKTLTIAEGTSVQHKSQSTESVDIHLIPGTYVNICLPNKSIVTVHPDALYVYDHTETLIHTADTHL